MSQASGLGGAELSMIEDIVALQQCKVKSFVILPRDGELHHALKRMNVQCTIIPSISWVYRKKDFLPKLFTLLLSLINSLIVLSYILHWRINLVISNTLIVPPFGAIAAKLAKIKSIWYIHEFGYEDHGLRFVLGDKISYNIINRMSDLIIVNSYAVMKKVNRYISLKKLRVVYYSVDYHWFTQRKNSENKIAQKNKIMEGAIFKVGLVAVLARGKNQIEAIQALHHVLNSGNSARLYLIGKPIDMEYLAKIKSLMRAINMVNYIEFLGYFSNPRSIMKNMDAIISCSISEAFGRVIVEAMKVGKPVIVPNIGGPTEIVHNMKNGLIYKIGEPIDLANKIRLLMHDNRLRKELSEKGLLFAWTNFNTKVLCQRLIDILKELELIGKN